MKKFTALVLILTMLMTGMAALPAQARESYVNARTTLAGSSSGKLANIDLAAAAVDGCYVAYGQSFSFNDVVGPRTSERGYVSAVNGRGAKVRGGGVSQVATTLYLALRQVPGQIAYGELMTYGSRFTDNYVSDGDLAIVTDYNAEHDLFFTNYAQDMYISMWTTGSYLYCSITLEDDDGWGFDWSTPKPFGKLAATASIYCGNEGGVLHNIDLAANSIYDTQLGYRDIFSFNDIVGPRNKSNGFVDGTNGRGVSVTGGGVAQVASVIWLAVKNMGNVSVLEKSTYGEKYNQSYVTHSSDAIVTDYGAGTDFSFRYNGGGTITIYTYLEGSMLTCDIYTN